MQITTLIQGLPYRLRWGTAEQIKEMKPGEPCGLNGAIMGVSSVWLIEDGSEKILFDTGSTGCRKLLLDRMQMLGLKPDSITGIILSHMHFDHIGNIALFPNAKVYISEAEWMFAHGDPDMWVDAPILNYIEEHMSYQLIREGFEVMPGLRVVELPGHTPGSIGLKYTDAEGNCVMIVADAIKNRFELAAAETAGDETIARILAEADILDMGHDIPMHVDGREGNTPIAGALEMANGDRVPFFY